MYLAKYGAAFSFTAPIPKINDTDFAASGDWTPATGDVKVSKDGGNVANITTLPAAVGGTGSVLWRWALSATEMQAAEVVIQVADAAVENQAFAIQTYGNASAQHAMDLDDGATLPAILADTRVLLSTTIGTVNSQTNFTLAAGLEDDDALLHATAIITDQSTATQKSFRRVIDFVASTDTVEINAAPDFTIATGDLITFLAADTYTDDMSNNAAAAAGVGMVFAAVTTDPGQDGDPGSLLDRIRAGLALEATLDGLDIDALLAALNALVPVQTTITVTNQTTLVLTEGSADDAAYDGWKGLVQDQGTPTQIAAVYPISYVGSTRTLALAVDPGIFTMATGDKIYLFPPASLAQDMLSSIAVNAANAMVTVDLQASIEAGSAAALIRDGMATAAGVANVQTEVDKIGAPANGTIAADIAAAKAETALIVANTGTDIPALLGVPANGSLAADIAAAATIDMSTAVPEGFSTDGQAPTLAQILHEIRQTAGDYSVNGTTLTVKNMAGSPVMTFELNDASQPTSRTRAT
jgi:hypothetical protein